MALGWQSVTAKTAVKVAVVVATQATSFAVPASNTIKGTGWYQQLSKAAPVAKAQQGSAFVPFNKAQIVVNPPNGWFGSISTAPKMAQAWPTQATSFAVPPSVAQTPGQFGWYAPLSKAVPVAKAKQGVSFVPFNTVQLSFSTAIGVALVQDAGVPRPVNVYYQSMFRALPPIAQPQNTVAQVTWQQPLSVAVKLAQAAPRGITFVPFNTVQSSNSISTFGWFSPLSKPAPVAVPNAGYSFVPFDTAQVQPPPVIIPPPFHGWTPATKNVETWSTISNVNGIWIPAIKNIEGWT